jgi:ferredoxin
MAIPTSRTKENGSITIITEKCNGCGLCVSVCSDSTLEISDVTVKISDNNSVFGCIACGHCMAVCPTGAIRINGRTLSPDDVFVLPLLQEAAGYSQLMSLLQRRRSIREFQDRAPDRATIDKIIETARTAPMGLPPSDVNVLVFDSKEKVNAFVSDYSYFLKGMKWFVSGWFLTLMRPFWGKANDEMFRDFIRPLFDVYSPEQLKKQNYVTYDAPLAMYFYGSPYTDPADPIIAATYAMLAGESLGLGTCMLGAIHPFIQSGKKAKKLREKYGIRYPSREGLFVIFGYPKVKYIKGIKRSFASVTFMS